MALIRAWTEKGKRLLAFLRPMGIPMHSAYTSFFLILSLFPALLLLLGLLKYTDLRLENMQAFAEGFLPQALWPTVHSILKASYQNGSGAVVSLSAATALWSASRGMLGLVRGLEAVYRQPPQRSYWQQRLTCVIYTFLFLVVLLLTLVAHVFGTAILDYLWMTTDPVLMLVMSIIDLRFLLLLLLQTALFTAMYALLGGKRRRLRDCFPGAVAASLGWLLFSRLFSIYVEHFSGYTNIFGSIYALALGMLWLYGCICIVFYGSALNRIIEETGK